MDIKDVILIVGFILIAAVVAHGLWIAWRARNDELPLRIEAVEGSFDPDSFGEDFPKGGAWPVSSSGHSRREAEERQPMLPIGVLAEPPQRPSPVGLEAKPAAEAVRREQQRRKEADLELFGDGLADEPATRSSGGSRVRRSPPAPTSGDLFPEPPTQEEAQALERAALELGISDVDLNDDPLMTEARGATSSATVAASQDAANQPLDEDAAGEEPSEVVFLQLLAAPGEEFALGKLCAIMHQHGLKFGEQNLFHRRRSEHLPPVYSVMSIAEPGFFDLATLENQATPGIALFFQLPGPDNPVAAFDDMVTIARRLESALQGRLVDDAGSALTQQTISHLREYVATFELRPVGH
ncbi:MAG: cell division protein ZipA C-terminal FtsZ-binding domain-containing protein [Pseudomonadota bacterium]